MLVLPQLAHRPLDLSFWVLCKINYKHLIYFRRTLYRWMFFSSLHHYRNVERIWTFPVLYTLHASRTWYFTLNPSEFGKRDICRSEVNHTEIGRAHIWKILNKIYQPNRIYGYTKLLLLKMLEHESSKSSPNLACTEFHLRMMNQLRRFSSILL